MPYIYITDPQCCPTCNSTPCCCKPADCDSCADPDPCVPETGCPVVLDCSCVIYHKNGGTTGLTNLELPNGSNLCLVLDTIDDFLGTLSSYSFPPFTTTCIGIANTQILTLTDFMQAVDDEFCSVHQDLDTLNASITTQITNLTSVVNTINHPNMTSSCVGLIISNTDTIAQILVKLKNAYCSLYSTIISDQSPIFAPNESSTVSWFLAGIKNHTPTANVKKSLQAGNVLQILPDGLFVGALPATAQSLSFDGGTHTLSLSGGGGSVVIPDLDAQTLSLNVGTKVLTISNGNSVNLTPIMPVFTQTAINPTDSNSIDITASGTANTNITADVKISGDANNIISIHADGLYATATTTVDTDELVKASAAGTAGTLINKTEGCVTGPVTIAVTYDAGADKLKICGTLNETTLLSDIAGTPALLTAFCNMVKGCSCFKFRFINTDVAPSTYGYTECDGTIHTGLAIGAGVVVEVCGIRATTGANTVYVFNLGFC